MKYALIVLAMLVFAAGTAFGQTDTKKEKDGWPKTVTAGQSLNLGDGRTINCQSGSVKVECREKDGKMTFQVFPRQGSVYSLGNPGETSNDWSDTAVYTGDGTTGEVYGVNCNIICNGTGSNINTHGGGGGTVKTKTGSSLNTGEIAGQGVSFTMKGSGNCFRYQGGMICD